ncbi:aromatic ring-hydroxylating oxygenase subunit alpha [Rhizomonospora bruguierae]|uniref:aromatic ring-hydroxylating oxygenase subunit alpha n=1 Tax=Rhizomonospora bruguierae TaxID=1581705 RepID=UPI001BD0D6D5|nr:Rieske 2Fe-2S domain-containing protein [Micromonospora sp. NBRC 107566]
MTESNEAADPGLVWTGPKRFRVRTAAYVDPVVFAREMKRVFESNWVFVAHESEISEPGNYKTSHIGLQPVIISRDDDRQIHVLLNRCVHRGAAVCREQRGSANLFRCPYHGWMYGNDGKLVGMSLAGGDAGYDSDFDRPEGLVRVPRVESYRGMVFASLNPDVKPLVEYLGRAAWIIDNKLDASPVGQIQLRSKPIVARYPGNWKFQAENIVDGYHFSFVHEGFTHLQRQYQDATGDFGVHAGNDSPADVRRVRSRGRNYGTPNGHGLTARPVADLVPWLEGKHGAYYRELLDAYGEERLKMIAGRSTASIFPNLGLIHHQIRVWRPLSANLTEVTVYPYDLVGVDEEINRGWLRSQERFYGAAGYGQPDDTEVFAVNQQGLSATAVDWLILERGLHAERDEGGGDWSGQPGGEVPQRSFWLEWMRRMESQEEQS